MKAPSLILLFFLSLIPCNEMISQGNVQETYEEPVVASTVDAAEQTIRDLFERFPANTIGWDAFQKALTGLYNLQEDGRLTKPHLLTLIDFSKASTEERLFVIDLKRARILHSCLVAHGKNSGENMATRFSNVHQSYQSSLGFYLTAETYQGKHGYSLRLDGLEKGFNDQARDRAVVMHGADYVSESFAKQHGRIGRSLGCPALPRALTTPIINTISGGSLLFIYAPQETYLQQSAYLKAVQPDCMLDALAFMGEL